MQLTTGITKSTRKSVKLLTILVAFSSHLMKRGTRLFILYKNMRDNNNDILFSPLSLIIHINVSLCDTIYCTTSLYFVQLTMDDGSSETCLV